MASKLKLILKVYDIIGGSSDRSETIYLHPFLAFYQRRHKIAQRLHITIFGNHHSALCGLTFYIKPHVRVLVIFFAQAGFCKHMVHN